MLRAKLGEPAAFAAIYEQYQSAICTYVFYKVESAALAEDLSAEVLVRMVVKIEAFTKQGRSILAWPHTIARYPVVDPQRREMRIVWLQQQEGDGKEAADNTSEEMIEARIDQVKLVRALQQRYDAPVSVGVFEHVGEDRLPAYFSRAWRLLEPGGVFLNHGIARTTFEKRSHGPYFFDTNVFRDSELVPVNVAVHAAEEIGFEVRDTENLPEHYAFTL